MKFDSPIFDRIRVKPDRDRRLRAERPNCDWPGCTQAATHRAPKGRAREREYWRFCLDHVREYNQSYNFFDGMSDEAVARYQKDAITGHRPTWKIGSMGGRSRARLHAGTFFESYGAADDPFGVFRELGGAPHLGAEPRRNEAQGRAVRNAERKAFHSLGLEIDAVRDDIKARFKELVKRHHPDVNGGDRGSEDKLREIIQAYNYLKSAGFC
ncbi:MAG: DnaJ domain-containing protein [Bradyrhizobiaceae bacterium]|nr:DnaJ domain-containing protein [Bradyrhizobiaceae bacterium]